jgi:hypothetical protein
MRCGDIYSENLNSLAATWHSPDYQRYLIYWRVWMLTWWDDPNGAVKGWYWYSPTGWAPAPSPWYGPYHMNGFGIAEFQRGAPPVVESFPWMWSHYWQIGYSMYSQAWAQLYVWLGDVWVTQLRRVPTYGSPADAPGWCFNP